MMVVVMSRRLTRFAPSARQGTTNHFMKYANAQIKFRDVLRGLRGVAHLIRHRWASGSLRGARVLVVVPMVLVWIVWVLTWRWVGGGVDVGCQCSVFVEVLLRIRLLCGGRFRTLCARAVFCCRCVAGCGLQCWCGAIKSFGLAGSSGERLLSERLATACVRSGGGLARSGEVGL